MEPPRKQSMAPVGSIDAVLLLLGSLPGEASLAAQRYYAHPANQFWRLLGGALDEPLAALDYPERLARLAERGVALWDVVAEARRKGSLDGAIRGASVNPLAEFVAAHPRLAGIGFNGQTAARLGRATLGSNGSLVLIDLPSSSPAYTVPLVDKAQRWAMLGALALPRKTVTLAQ
jgi:hypoxanthine-DNA glycosylase